MRRTAHLRQVRPVQAAWLALTAITAIAWMLVFLPNWQALRTPCHPQSACASFQLDTASAHTLSQHGITMIEFAVGTTAALAIIWAIQVGLGALIIWRKPDDRGAVLSAFVLVLALAFEISSFIPNAENLGGIVSISALYVFGLLFPDGRFVPHWTRWMVVPGVALAGIPVGPLPVPAVVSATSLLSIPLAIIGVQVYRYRRVSSWEQRQQTKWALTGIVAGLLGFIGLAIPYAVAPQIAGYGSVYDGFVNVTGTAAVTSLIPVFIGIAVLRSRLWDIDRVINRALVYTSLTLTLGAVYVLSIVLLQGFFHAVTGQSSDLAVAISTLGLAALFNPWRRRLQRFIDRRFYHSKYDAQRILASLGERLRDQVDVGRLAEDLEGTVNAALSPEHISLWLRDAPTLRHEEGGGDHRIATPTAASYS